MEYSITAEIREITNKKAKALRKHGLVPGAIYGFHGNYNIQLSSLPFSQLYKEAGTTALVSLTLDGKKHNCYIEEVQMNPVTREYTHVSFREVNMREEMTAEVPFELSGQEESLAVKEQESLIILSKPTVELRGLPTNLPQSIIIDVSKMNAGDTITLKDIVLPEGVVLVHEEDLEEVIATTVLAVQAQEAVDVNAEMEAKVAEEAAAESTEVEEKQEKAE